MLGNEYDIRFAISLHISPYSCNNIVAQVLHVTFTMPSFNSISISIAQDFQITVVMMIIAVFLIALFTRIIQSLYRVGNTEKNSSHDEPLKERKMDFFELVLDEFHAIGGASICAGFGLKSNEKLSYKTVHEALACLSRRYPAPLRTVVSIKPDKNEKIEKVLHVVDDKELIDLKQVDVCDSDWVKVWEDEVQTQFDCENGPLWRTTLLKERYNPLTKTYHNAILFTFYHGTMDGMSVLKFAQEFMICLDGIAKGTLKVEDEVNKERCSMQQGVITLMGSYLPLFYKIFQWFLPLCILRHFVLFAVRIHTMFEAKNPITSKFSDVVRKINDKEAKNKIIQRRLNPEMTEKLLKLCRKNRCTVQGTMSALCHLAVVRLVNQDQETGSPIRFSWYCPVNVRAQCRLSEENLGHYTTLLMENVKVPRISTRNPREFWKYALQCTQAVHGGIYRGRHLYPIYLLPVVHLLDPKEFVSEFLLHSKMDEPEFISPAYTLTNLGKINFEKKPEDAFEFDNVFGGSGAFRHGATFVNHILTFNGVFTWSTTYFTGNITSHVAHQYVSLVFDNLDVILAAAGDQQ